MSGGLQVSQVGEGGSSSTRPAAEDMTSKDYYFDSYAHFGIHEVAPSGSGKVVILQDTLRMSAVSDICKSSPPPTFRRC